MRQNVEEMQVLLETLPIGVLIAHDPECQRITGNRSASELLRVSPGENLSKSAVGGEAPLHFRTCRNNVEIPPEKLPVQRAAHGERVYDETIDQVFNDGTVVNTVVSAMPLYDAAGKPRGAVGTILDLTELKRGEARAARRRSAQGRVPRHARARAAQSARADPQGAAPARAHEPSDPVGGRVGGP